MPRKLPAKYMSVAVSFVLSILMSSIISGVVTVRNVGLVHDFPVMWLKAGMSSWFVAFPTVLVLLPPVRRFVGLFVEAPRH